MKYGSIRYVNNLPVDHALVAGHVARPDGLEIVDGTPTELNARLLDGRLDVSAVSAAVVATGRRDLTILPEATIASHGRIDSVLLLSKVPIDRLDGREIAVTAESATGALLLRILLENDVGVRPRYRTAPSTPGAMLRASDAALLIGDDALRVSAGASPTGEAAGALDDLHVLDLGEAWRGFTGLPMVYAVWATPAAFAHAHVDELAALRRALLASKAWGHAHRDRVIAVAAERARVPRPLVETYYSRLSHSLGPDEHAGLRRFAAEAARLDSGPSQPIPAILEAVP